MTWDEAAMQELLNSPDGPVGRMLAELSAAVAALARSRAPVRGPGSTWSSRSDAQPPGLLQASVGPGVTYIGGLIYGGATAAADPAVFLEDPAEQLHRRYPFMSSSLWDVMDGAGL